MISALVFDLDDTLYPERDYIRSGFRAVGEWAEARFGLAQPLVQAELQSYFDAGFRSDAFQWWLAEKGLPEPLLAEMVRLYREHPPQLRLADEARLLLDGWKTRYKLGLLTEGRRAGQEAKIAALGLDGWMDAIVVGGEEERADWKPSRKPFDRILGMLGVSGACGAHIGDNPAKDFRGAREAGMVTIRLRREDGLHAGEEPAAAEDAPDLEIRSLADLDAALAVRVERF